MTVSPRPTDVDVPDSDAAPTTGERSPFEGCHPADDHDEFHEYGFYRPTRACDNDDLLDYRFYAT